MILELEKIQKTSSFFCLSLILLYRKSVILLMIITKSTLALMISFLLSIFLGILLIPVLKKWKASQSLNEYLKDAHRNKKGTPTMGGIIFVLSSIITLFFLYFFKKIEINQNVVILLITFLGYFFIGFLDDFLIILKHNNKGLSENAKLILQIIISIIFFYLFMKAGNEPLLWIHSLHIKWDIGFFYGFFILFILVATSNAVNLTDGLDGLATGLCIIAYFAMGIITLGADWLLGYETISLFCFIIVGSLLGFLFFNASPAKVFMGDTGSLALGGLLGALSIITRHELLLAVLGIVFVIETLSVILQRLYYKKTKKRLFPMTPLHHSFEKKGFSERDIVKIFWVIGLIGAFFSIIYGVWL